MKKYFAAAILLNIWKHPISGALLVSDGYYLCQILQLKKRVRQFL